MKKRDANKKTIALFSTLSFPIPAVCGGGVETLITNLIDVNEELNQVRFLVSSKYNKTACKKNYHNSDIYYFKNGILLSPVGLFLYIRWRYYRLRFKKSSQRNTTPMDFITYQYRYIAKREKVDVIVLENPYRLEKFAALKDIVSEENIYYHLHWTESGTGSGNIIDRQVIPNSISISEYVKNKWIKDNPQFGKNYVVYNCVDVERFSARVKNRDEEREKLGFTKQDFVVLFCGRFIPEKGPETDRGIDLKLTGGICFPHALFLPKALSGACNRQPFPFLRAAFHKPSARSEKETGRQKDFLLRRRFCCTIISGPVPYLRSAPEKIGRRTADLRKEFL